MIAKGTIVTKIITDDDSLKEALNIRKKVFVEEQGVSEELEYDKYDNLNNRQCEHILVYFNETPVGTGRLKIVDGIGKLERICVLKPYRKFNIGREIMSALEDLAKSKGISKVKLHAQKHAEGFYKKLGYQTSSDVFMEAGIPHILMIKEL